MEFFAHAWPVIETVLTVVVAGGIGGLAIYMAYRTGHSSGFDAGARSDAKGFYRPSADPLCNAHDCPEKAECKCYGGCGDE